jgi:hypothetical protein
MPASCGIKKKSITMREIKGENLKQHKILILVTRNVMLILEIFRLVIEVYA